MDGAITFGLNMCIPNASENLNEQLIDAAVHYDVEKMKTLLSKGADFNAVDSEEGTTAFAEAIATGVSHDCVFEMLSLGANADVQPTTGGTPLIFAVWKLDILLLKRLLEAGANPNTPGYLEDGGRTPLDAVADEYHCHDDRAVHLVIQGLEMLLKSRGAKFFYELKGK